MPGDLNPYVPPRTGSESQPSADTPLGDAWRLGWVTYGSWLGVATAVVCSAMTVFLAQGLSHFGGQEFIPAVQALSIVRDHAGSVASAAALFASITFVHHYARGRARLRT